MKDCMNARKSPLLLAVALLLTLLWVGCGSGSNSETTLNPDSLSTTVDAAADTNAADLPSPVQMALSILKAEAPYNGELLNPSTKADAYSNTFTQAINLGVYQADLGYLIAHHQTQGALDYFRAVKKLGDKLGILGAFDDAMMQRAEKNLDSRDSLFAILNEVFRDADVYLNENAMLASADLIVVGGWLESTYHATQILKTTDSGPLRKRVGADKDVLPKLLTAIESHKGSADHEALAKQLQELNTIYSEIKIKRIDAAPVTDEAKHITRITDKTKIRYTPETLAKITDKVASIRNMYVK